VNVSITVTTADGKVKTIKHTGPERCFTTNEIKALVQASARFEIIDFYGSMKSDVPFSNEKKSWRMIPVLQKI
ncbi:hypothetical protein ACFL35_17215, partial [Candidatus Riflebacteria bacterium]